MANRFCLWVHVCLHRAARPQRRFIELQQFFAGAPKTIAPNLPLPMGKASVHTAAGCLYQSCMPGCAGRNVNSNWVKASVKRNFMDG